MDYPNLNCFNWFQISLSITAKKVSDLERRKRKVGERKKWFKAVSVKWSEELSEVKFQKEIYLWRENIKAAKKAPCVVRQTVLGGERKKEGKINQRELTVRLKSGLATGSLAHGFSAGPFRWEPTKGLWPPSEPTFNLWNWDFVLNCVTWALNWCSFPSSSDTTSEPNLIS